MQFTQDRQKESESQILSKLYNATRRPLTEKEEDILDYITDVSLEYISAYDGVKNKYLNLSLSVSFTRRIS